jgi:hypothetical protein
MISQFQFHDHDTIYDFADDNHDIGYDITGIDLS